MCIKQARCSESTERGEGKGPCPWGPWPWWSWPWKEVLLQNMSIIALQLKNAMSGLVLLLSQQWQ